MNNKKPILSVGGQALINGIMMTSPLKTAISVRKPDGEILTTDFEFSRNKSVFTKIPIIRGCVNFIESMKIGMKAMNYSAEISMLEEDNIEENHINNTDDLTDKINENIEDVEQHCSKDNITDKIIENTEENNEIIFEDIEDDMIDTEDITEENKGNKIITAVGSIIGTILGLFLSVILFMWLPSTLYNILPISDMDYPLLRSVFEGTFKLIIMIGYMGIISYIPDIRKVFQYHGAEHKTIFCYENNLELTIENIKKQSRFHPRCGTSFIIIAIIVSIVTGFFIPEVNPIIRTIIKVLLLPITMGLSYELIRICGKHNNIITKILSAPGCWIQRITTKEPTDDIIEVAIAALTAVLK